MIEQGQKQRSNDRRQSTAWFSSLTHDRRRARYERRGQEPVSVGQGQLRQDYAAAVPLVDRRVTLSADVE